jgi:sugar/nucleoside kinase (ribokinase family)
VVAGHLCLDIIPRISMTPEQFQASFGPGRLVDVGPVTVSTGGPVSNTGLVLHKIGIPTQLMGKIGDDLFGQAVVQVVSRIDPGLASGMIVDPAVATSYTVIVNPPGMDRIFLHCPGANDAFGANDVRYDLVAQARLFHFGYPPLMRRMYADGGHELTTIFRRARETGVTTSLDMALPDSASPAGRADWAGIMGMVLPYVDVFLPSVEEILYMLRREQFEALRREGQDRLLAEVTPELLGELSDALLGMGARIVGLKLGHRGLYLRTAGQAAIEGMGRARPSDAAAWAGREIWSPCFQVNVVGTTGSGDSTIAGFLSALLRDQSPREAVTAAVAVGACNVEAADTLGGIRPWEETMARVATGWPKHFLKIETLGWRWDPMAGLWTHSRAPSTALSVTDPSTTTRSV